MKKTILLTALIILSIACGSQKSGMSQNGKNSEKSDDQEYRDRFQNAKELIGREKYSSAILNIDHMTALQLNNGDYTPQRYKAMILQVTGEKEEANIIYQSIINATDASASEKNKARQLMLINNEKKAPLLKEINRLKDSTEFKNAIKVIEVPPMFPGCETLPQETWNKCMSRGVAKHIVRTIDVDIAQVTSNTGFIRSYVNYEIDTTGHISKIKATGKNKFLNLEAHRVMAQLPQVTPGYTNGEKVVVSYTIPIRFTVD
ncbi:hypothetical protein [Nonlabens ulvanivorans]|uniref:hypothetical protein n=1 Tax=Nonlabens ulvanivorans TaxID=906888 RepID=UPI002942217D|nr:hypothetical protein [Nonlabens ulvanivorans]WOI23418.1 hypothetical protein R1T42_02975 [Nonlabens ulvanivorans]